MQKRAEQQDRTRRRIVEAAVALHTSIGPARTTIKGIADLAGVERLTVYRHFPDMQSLFLACCAHHVATNPVADPARFSVGDPDKRLREALAAEYGYYTRNEQGVAAILRDAEFMPGGGHAYFRHWDDMTDVLIRGRLVRDARRASVRGAIHHALEFATWRSLVRNGGFSERRTIDLMVGLVRLASGTT